MKLSHWIQSFEEIRTQNYIYIDKTMFINEMENSWKYIFLSRPRRFGKSLFVDTLHCMFEWKKELFEWLYIYDKWDWDETYPVIKIDFWDWLIKNEIVLEKRLMKLLNDIAKKEELEIDFDIDLLGEGLKDVIISLNEKYNQQVVVLIDEYDKPILDKITDIKMAVKMKDVLKWFYSVLKSSDKYLKLVFITWVRKFSKVSLFSWLNNPTDISLDPDMGEICGYTEQDIKQSFWEYLEWVDFIKLKQWYNWFNFLWENKMYNPTDVLLYLRSKEYKNYWFETATPTFLINMLKENQYFIPDIENIIAWDEILWSFDIEYLSLETLLYQSWYLTIDEKIKQWSQYVYQLKYPNLEIKISLTNYILLSLIWDKIVKWRNYKKINDILEVWDLNWFKDVVKSMYSSIPHDWYKKNNIATYEWYYASVFYSYLYWLWLDTIPEDTTNKWQIDLTVKLNKRVFIFEFKVIEWKTEESVQTDNIALKQIEEKKYHEKYMASWDEIYLVGIVFDKEERNVVKYDWKRVKM